MPWLLQDWCDAEPSYRDIVLKESSSPAEPPCLKLPRANTDWYQLYHDITIHWDELKGLQNRRRIWKDVEEIISRITRYREAGRILDESSSLKRPTAQNFLWIVTRAALVS
jgi:hypothetical protein